MKPFWKEDLGAPYGDIKRGSVLVFAWNATIWLKSKSVAGGVQLTLASSSNVDVDERLEVLAQAVSGSKVVARIQLKEDGGATVGSMMRVTVLAVASDGQQEPFDFFLNLVDTSVMPCAC